MIAIAPETILASGKVRDTETAPNHAVYCDRHRTPDGRAWHNCGTTSLCGAKMSCVHPFMPYAKTTAHCMRCEIIVNDLKYDLQDKKMMTKLRRAMLGVMLAGFCLPVNAGYSVTRTVTREPIVVTATAGDCACSCVVCDCCTVKKTVTRTRAANPCRCKPATEIVKTRTVIR